MMIKVFRDEELIPDVVIDFVNEYRKKEWVNMFYFAVPLWSQKFILGKTHKYIQWDKNRNHVRKIPSHAIQSKSERIYDQSSMDDYTASFFKGKIAFVNGIRASESLIRYRASVNKLNENYINAVGNNHNVKLVNLANLDNPNPK